ncbi:MAG: MaoC family dehydratase [Blastocatellia bacterium]
MSFSVGVGQQFTFRRTFTEGDVALFVGVTGDYNPFHIDEEFAKQTWFGRRNIPGLLTASMATHIGGMLGFLATEMSFQFLKPVYAGDTITCTCTVAEKDESKRQIFCTVAMINQDGVEVLTGSFRGFPSLVRLAR